METRRPPPLPVPPKTGLVPEPGIPDDTYEHILQFIRHQGRTFERTPATYSVHGEEGLRNIVLAQLNGYFEGDAIGEAFRGSGKTDICIEQDNRAAFVGECKLWTGPAGLIAALDQLLGYLRELYIRVESPLELGRMAHAKELGVQYRTPVDNPSI